LKDSKEITKGIENQLNDLLTFTQDLIEVKKTYVDDNLENFVD
jgi:hypothetical protein